MRICALERPDDFLEFTLQLNSSDDKFTQANWAPELTH